MGYNPSLGLLNCDRVHATLRCCWHPVRPGHTAGSRPACCPPALPAPPAVLGGDPSEPHGAQRTGSPSVLPTVAWQEGSSVPGPLLPNSSDPPSRGTHLGEQTQLRHLQTVHGNCGASLSPPRGSPGARAMPLCRGHSLNPLLRSQPWQGRCVGDPQQPGVRRWWDGRDPPWRVEGRRTPGKPTIPRIPTAPRGLQRSYSRSQSRAAQPKRGPHTPVPCHPSVARPLVLCRPRGTGARIWCCWLS